MFAYETDFDPITPTDGDLLTEIGLDPHAVREALADDRARGERSTRPPGRSQPIVINQTDKEIIMSFGLNRVELIGRLGADVSINNLTNGGRVANLSIATDESYIDKNTGNRVDKTEWHRVVTFQPGLVDMLVRNAKKGRLVYVAGKMQTRRWRKDGEDSDRFSSEILLVPGSRIQFLDRANGNGAAVDAQTGTNGSAATADDIPAQDTDSEIPF